VFVSLSVKAPGSNLGQGSNCPEDFLDSPECFQVKAESVLNDATTLAPCTVHSYWRICTKKSSGKDI
jgi:hypothetical protein